MFCLWLHSYYCLEKPDKCSFAFVSDSPVHFIFKTSVSKSFEMFGFLLEISWSCSVKINKYVFREKEISSSVLKILIFF